MRSIRQLIRRWRLIHGVNVNKTTQQQRHPIRNERLKRLVYRYMALEDRITELEERNADLEERVAFLETRNDMLCARNAHLLSTIARTNTSKRRGDDEERKVQAQQIKALQDKNAALHNKVHDLRECPVCIETLDPSLVHTRLTCGHWYHTRCFRMMVCYNALCAVCRASISQS